MTTRGVLCVFAKPPRPGKVKTRLAARLGPERAAELAQAFFADTWASIAGLEWAKPVLATTAGDFSDFGISADAEVWLQGEGDLGCRIERILQRGLEQAPFVIAIGADSPGLPPRLVEHARSALTRADAVLGPAEDGGFYLVGVRRCPPGLFDHLPWSSDRTFACTRARIESQGLSSSVLESWFDVDRDEDLDRLHGMISRGLLWAPHTARVLFTEPLSCP